MDKGIKNKLFKYNYMKTEFLLLDDENENYISLQPSSQYTFYDYVNMKKIYNIITFLFKNTSVNQIWIGNWLYNREDLNLIREKEV